MKPAKTYQQSAVEQQHAASKGFAAEITRLGERLLAVANQNAAGTIEAANITRSLGMELSAWLNREQMRFEQFEGFFRDHAAELPTWLDSNAARKLIAAHRAHPEEISTLREAVEVMNQMTFFAVGLLEEPKRMLPQTASGITPLEKLKTIWGKEREALEKFEESMPREKWTTQVWQTVFVETKLAAELREEAKKALGAK